MLQRTDSGPGGRGGSAFRGAEVKLIVENLTPSPLHCGRLGLTPVVAGVVRSPLGLSAHPTRICSQTLKLIHFWTFFRTLC